MPDEVRRVEAADWVSGVAAALAQGWCHLDWLGVVDEWGRAADLRVVLRLLEPASAAGLRIETLVPRAEPVLDSLGTLLAGARWHEREASDLFGVHFAGGDDRPLLVPARGAAGELREWPLRKDAVLAARVALPWPGAATGDDTTRRRLSPPGVPAPEQFGARPADAGPLDAAALLAPPRRRR